MRRGGFPPFLMAENLLVFSVQQWLLAQWFKKAVIRSGFFFATDIYEYLPADGRQLGGFLLHLLTL